jgi:hypothetical protein
VDEILKEINALLERQENDYHVDKLANNLIIAINSARNQELYQRNQSSSEAKEVVIHLRWSH